MCRGGRAARAGSVDSVRMRTLVRGKAGQTLLVTRTFRGGPLLVTLRHPLE